MHFIAGFKLGKKQNIYIYNTLRCNNNNKSSHVCIKSSRSKGITDLPYNIYLNLYSIVSFIVESVLKFFIA